MKNKYYTPSIEEFHVGFEYEEREFIYTNKEWYTEKVHKYIPKIYEGDNYLEAYYLTERMKRKLFNDTVRVKYLDKEDIESLGFILTGEYLNGVEMEFQKFKTNYQWIVLSTSFDNEITIEHEIDVDKDGYKTSSHTLFNGIIKNKSELKVLLKQLGIK